MGVVFPSLEIEPDATAIRDFAQAVEAMGYTHLVAYDHVVGADIANRPNWDGPYTCDTPFQEPLILFAFLAGLTRRLIFATGVVILPQRQTALFAKQAANLDIVANGRLRIGVGIGWNAVEYEALGVPFAKRGARLDEQIRVLRRLWTERVVTEHSSFHDISEAGINPMPLQKPIPLWIGGNSEAALQRAAKIGDGWMPGFAAENAYERMSAYRDAVVAAGRGQDCAELENLILLGTTVGGPLRTAEDAVLDAAAWRSAGARGVTIHTMAMGLRGADEHIALLQRIANMLALQPNVQTM